MTPIADHRDNVEIRSFKSKIKWLDLNARGYSTISTPVNLLDLRSMRESGPSKSGTCLQHEHLSKHSSLLGRFGEYG